LSDDAARADARAAEDMAEMPDLRAGAQHDPFIDDRGGVNEDVAHAVASAERTTGPRLSSARWQASSTVRTRMPSAASEGGRGPPRTAARNASHSRRSGSAESNGIGSASALVTTGMSPDQPA